VLKFKRKFQRQKDNAEVKNECVYNSTPPRAIMVCARTTLPYNDQCENCVLLEHDTVQMGTSLLRNPLPHIYSEESSSRTLVPTHQTTRHHTLEDVFFTSP